MSETTAIPLKDLRKWLEDQTVPMVEPLKAEGRSLLNNVRTKLDDVVETCNKLIESAEKEMIKGTKYHRAKATSKLAKNISEMIDKVAVPEEVSRESLHILLDELGKTLVTIERERGKWFPLISPYFIIDRRRFDVALKKAIDQLQELRSFLSNKYAKAEAVENTFSMVDELSRLLSELDEASDSQKKMESRKSFLETKIAEDQQREASIQTKNEVIALVQVNKKIEELEEKAKTNLGSLQKPFLKLQSLVRASSFSLPPAEMDKLNEYLNRPFAALASEEERYPILKRILQKMEEALQQGKLELKSSRLRKAQSRINEILHKDSLVSLQRNCREAVSGRQRLSTSGEIAASQSELEKIQEDLRELQKLKETVDSRSAISNTRIQELLEKIESQRKSLEKAVLERTGKKVQVTF